MIFLGMPKSIRQAFPLLKTFVARFMTTSCLILSRDLSSTSSSVHVRQFDEEWLTSVAFVCFRQFMTQSHFFFKFETENRYVLVSTTRKWSVDMHNVASLDGNGNFISKTWSIEFVGFVLFEIHSTSVQWNSEVSSINSNFCQTSIIVPFPLLPINLL